MKTSKMILIVVGGLLISSCKKTYVCKDQAGVTTGEVKASSQSKASAMCPAGSASPK